MTFVVAASLIPLISGLGRSLAPLGRFFHRPECDFHADVLKILMLRDEAASLPGRPQNINGERNSQTLG